MTDKDEAIKKYWNPFDSFMKWLMGPDYRESFGEIGRDYINTSMENFRYQYIPDKGSTLGEISSATGDIMETMTEAGNQKEKPDLYWGEIYLETLDANLPPYIQLLEAYKGKGAPKVHYTAKQLTMIYADSARSRLPNRGFLSRIIRRDSQFEQPDLKAIAVKVNYQLKPHFESIRKEVLRYEGKKN